jgi:hypothetical protein
VKIVACLCCLIFSVLAGHGAEFDLGAHGTLSITVPEGWNIHGRPLPGPGGNPRGYTFAIKPRSDANAKCMLSFFYVTNGAPNKEAIRKDVLRIGETYVEGSVEKKENLSEFSLEKGYGAYCLFTDVSLVGKKPSPEDYKVMGSGEVQPGDNMVGAVSLLADEADGPEFKAMVKIINSLKIKPKDAK